MFVCVSVVVGVVSSIRLVSIYRPLDSAIASDFASRAPDAPKAPLNDPNAPNGPINPNPTDAVPADVVPADGPPPRVDVPSDVAPLDESLKEPAEAQADAN